jgi:hypothetical protein
MTGFAFTANGPLAGFAPTGNGGVGPWLLPARSFDAHAYQSWGILTGQPGTQFIPAPDAAAIPPGVLPTMGRGNIAWPLRRRSSSRDSPQQWLPALYYQRVLPNGQGSASDGTGLGPNVSWISDNQLPVPAVDPRGRPAVMAQPPARIGGRAHVPQTYNPVAWPKWTGPSVLAPQ